MRPFRTSTPLVAFVLALLVGASVAAALPVSAGTGPDSASSAPQVDAPPDPESDVLGWEEGRWHNESIAVTREDGLNDTELDAVVARSMARVEYIRRLEFEETVPVEVVSREEFRRENAGRWNASANDSLHQNVKFEALFLVGEDRDVLDVQQQNFGSSVLGYYSPAEERIVVVSDDAETPRMDEITLAQELFHALQDQKFNLTSYNRSTEDASHAVNGIIEGDGNYVDYLYEQRCKGGWNGTCLLPSDQRSTRQGGEIHYGLLYYSYQPYSDGPAFVQRIQDAGGWEAVNAVYERPPESTEQVIHPDTYREDAPTRVRVEDTSDERWRVLEMGPNGIDYAVLGEAGLYMMLLYPGLRDQGQSGVIPVQSFLNGQPGSLPTIDPFNYSHPATAGWDGDKLVPYVASDDPSANETGYVWKIAWDSPEDARQFADAYRELLGVYGAERVGDGTYRIADGPFADAFHLAVEGNETVVVNAPTVDALSGVRSSVDVENATTGANATGTADATRTPGGENATDRPQSDGISTGLPGFTVPLAALALLLAAAVAARVRGRR